LRAGENYHVVKVIQGVLPHIFREVYYGEQKDSSRIDSPSVQRVQKAQLYNQQEQAQYSGKTGIQQILPP